MKTHSFIIGLMAGIILMPAQAAESVRNASAPGNHAEIEAALKVCSAQVGVDAQGRPDRTAFDTCMKAKGLEKPVGPPPGGRGGQKGPPPQ